MNIVLMGISFNAKLPGTKIKQEGFMELKKKKIL